VSSARSVCRVSSASVAWFPRRAGLITSAKRRSARSGATPGRTRARSSRRRTAPGSTPRQSRIAHARSRNRNSARASRSRPERCVAGQRGFTLSPQP
jgi:hypothetical protein